VVPPGRGGEVDRLGVRVVSYGQSRKQRVIGKVSARREKGDGEKEGDRRAKKAVPILRAPVPEMDWVTAI
jgi:hypothetical protein